MDIILWWTNLKDQLHLPIQRRAVGIDAYYRKLPEIFWYSYEKYGKWIVPLQNLQQMFCNPTLFTPPIQTVSKMSDSTEHCWKGCIVSFYIGSFTSKKTSCPHFRGALKQGCCVYLLKFRIPYRTKIRQKKLTKFRLRKIGEENCVQRKFCSIF